MKIIFFEKFDKLQSDTGKIIFCQLKREVHNFVQSLSYAIALRRSFLLNWSQLGLCYQAINFFFEKSYNFFHAKLIYIRLHRDSRASLGFFARLFLRDLWNGRNARGGRIKRKDFMKRVHIAAVWTASTNPVSEENATTYIISRRNSRPVFPSFKQSWKKVGLKKRVSYFSAIARLSILSSCLAWKKICRDF